MADMIVFPLFSEEMDLDSMDQIGLLDCLEQVKAQLELLDDQEPDDMNSQEYELWGDRHEALEDLADEIRERMDEI